VKIIGHSWASDNSYANLTVKNLGTSLVTVIGVEVNGATADDVTIVSGESTLDAGETTIFQVTQSFMPSRRYEFAVVTASAKFPIIA
jgi:hypothetical protein